MAAERSHRYLSSADQLTHAPDGDQFEFDEADIWNVGEIILPESSKTAISSSRTLRKVPARKSVDVDQFPVGSKSLPLNIPNWSKIFGNECRTRASDWEDNREDREEDGNDRIPPHEYLARTRVASMSVHEGVGRTLKGRDLSDLRNAVMKKTGIED